MDGLKQSTKEKDDQITKLEQKLQEFIRLKEESENQVLEKFSLLLNEKKLKIRDQQRLLASANVDPTKIEEVEESGLADRSRSAGPSRGGKRKAGQAIQEDSGDSDGGFEKMDVDKEPAAEDSDQDQAETPEASTADEATASEEEAESVPPPKRKVGRVTKGKAPAKVKATAAASKAGPSKAKTPPAPNAAPKTPSADVDKDEVPPTRELPFAKVKKPPAKAPSPQGSETESDDEL